MLACPAAWRTSVNYAFHLHGNYLLTYEFYPQNWDSKVLTVKCRLQSYRVFNFALAMCNLQYL